MLCSKCLIDKPQESFYRCVTNKRGYQSRCIPCCNQHSSEWNKNNKERRNAKRRKGKREKFSPEVQYEKKLAYMRVQYQTEKERIKKKVADWKKTNPHLVASINAKRRKGVQQATPKWANPVYIKLWYLIAKLEEKRIGTKCHVDHIIPLVNPMVCGLHNEYNLQVLTESENCSKQNSWNKAKEVIA